jgi:RNA polymerase sigma-70 factor (ECF subfamily)
MVDDDEDGDLVLLERWRNGDQRAGEKLCAKYFEEIYGFFVYKLPDQADDLTQQTFLACVKSRDRFQGRSLFRTYLFAIARNELLMQFRILSKKPDEVDVDSMSIADLVTSASKRIDHGRELERLRAALRRLPIEQQILLEFRYWHGLEAAALAEIYSATPGAIRVRLQRARDALRSRLGDPPDGSGPPGGSGPLGGSDPLSTSLREPDSTDEPADDPADDPADQPPKNGKAR